MADDLRVEDLGLDSPAKKDEDDPVNLIEFKMFS